MPTLVRLASNVFPDPLDGAGVLLQETDGFLLAEGDLPAAVAHALGQRPMRRAELQALLGERFDRRDVDDVLDGMLAERFLLETDAEVAPAVARRWRQLPAPMPRVRQALERRAVDVQGDSALANRILQALGRWSIARSSTSPAMTVVCARSLTEPALAVIDARMAASWMPWMLITSELGAVQAVFFAPGESACWRCLSARLLEGGRLPGSAHIPPDETDEEWDAAAEQLAYRIARVLVGDTPGREAGALFVYANPYEPPAMHPFEASPSCECLGRKWIQTPPDWQALRASRAERGPLDPMAWQYIRSLVDPVVGLFRHLEEVPVPAGMGNVHVVQHALARWRPSVEALRLNAGGRSVGKGDSPEASRFSALMEAVERRSGVWRAHIPVCRHAYADVADRAIHPTAIMGFDEAQYRYADDATHPVLRAPEVFDETRVIDWVEATSLMDGTTRLVPAALAFYDHPDMPLRFAIADSNGCAAGPTYAGALLGALGELIERDAIARWWYPMSPRPGIALTEVDEPYARRQLEAHASAGRDLWALDLTDDIGLPVVAAVSRSREDLLDISIGFGCAASYGAAVKGALLEVAQVLAIRAVADDPAPVFDEVDGVAASDAVMRCLYPSGEPREAAPPPPATLGDLLDRLQERGIEAYWLDQTDPLLGVPVVRILAPGMAHLWRRLGARRMREALAGPDRIQADAQTNPYSIVI